MDARNGPDTKSERWRGCFLAFRVACALLRWYDAVMNDNINENERESALLKSAMRLVSPPSRKVPLSKWSVPSLVVLRALEVAGIIDEDVVLGAFYSLTYNQAAPVLSTSLHAPHSGRRGVLMEGQVAALVACGATVDPGVVSPGGEGARWVCLRFPDSERYEKTMSAIARDMCSAAQSELDRRWSESHTSELA